MIIQRQDNKGKPIKPEPNEFASAFAEYGVYAKIIGDKHLMQKEGFVYKIGAEARVREITERIYPEATGSFINEVVRKLADRYPIEREALDADPNILVCPNGLVAITGKTPDTYHAMQEIVTEYRPDLGDQN